jgi:hypothetical protein
MRCDRRALTVGRGLCANDSVSIRRIATASASLLCLGLAFAEGCGGGNSTDAEPFDTFQACFDEHHVTESLPVHDAIVVCCIDHPIAGKKPACGATAADCMTYLGTNLSSSSATTDEVTMACADFETQLSM